MADGDVISYEGKNKIQLQVLEKNRGTNKVITTHSEGDMNVCTNSIGDYLLCCAVLQAGKRSGGSLKSLDIMLWKHEHVYCAC